MQGLCWWVGNTEKISRNEQEQHIFNVGQFFNSLTLQLEYLPCLGLQRTLGGTWPKLQKEWSKRKAWQGEGWSWVNLRGEGEGGEISSHVASSFRTSMASAPALSSVEWRLGSVLHREGIGEFL